MDNDLPPRGHERPIKVDVVIQKWGDVEVLREACVQLPRARARTPVDHVGAPAGRFVTLVLFLLFFLMLISVRS